jgi:hypothetical protein
MEKSILENKFINHHTNTNNNCSAGTKTVVATNNTANNNFFFQENMHNNTTTENKQKIKNSTRGDTALSNNLVRVVFKKKLFNKIVGDLNYIDE